MSDLPLMLNTNSQSAQQTLNIVALPHLPCLVPQQQCPPALTELTKRKVNPVINPLNKR